VQAISSDIAVFLEDWLQAALRPGTAAAREFPVGRVDAAIDQYVSELGAGRTETRERYERVRRTIRKTW
jgi:nuclear pore complex protein Nup155